MQLYYIEVLPFIAVPYTLIYTAKELVAIGTLVNITVKNIKTKGIVKTISTTPPQSNYKLSPINGLVYPEPIIFNDGIKIIEWISRYYACNTPSAIETALPTQLRQGKTFPRFYCFHTTNEVTKFNSRSYQQKAVYEWINKHPYCTQETFAITFPNQSSVLNKLIKKKYVERFLQDNVEKIPAASEISTNKITLNEEQKVALKTITKTLQQQIYTTYLLWGITGSGKTEIYHNLIYEAKKLGKQVLYLVPEITLSEQALLKIKNRLSDNNITIAVWHSRLTDTEKLHIWDQAIHGKIDVVLGTRSALFVPLQHLGLVIIDEEHEPSYKQSDNPRYHGRDLAIYKAYLTQSLCVLGTATPSAETWSNVKNGKYQIIKLTQRATGASLPKVHLVDMRYEKPNFEGTFILSRLLREKINVRLDRKEQTLLFLNRRGYAPYLYCPKCETRQECPHCKSHLVFHKKDATLRCHLCDFKLPAYTNCPKCHTPLKLSAGLGTQRIEACLQRFYPHIRTLRLDSDVIKEHPHWYNDILNHKYDIIVGTQMLAKGLDFPNITLVGVIQADGQNSLEDFRISERTFQLIIQVSGRAGRSEKRGEVIVQSFSPESDCIHYGINQAVETFLNKEYALRKQYLYPPFRHMIRHIFRSRSEKILPYVLNQWNEYLHKNLPTNIEILGPAYPTQNKVNGYYRMHMLYLTYNVLNDLPKLLQCRSALKIPKNVIDMWDVDPIDFR